MFKLGFYSYRKEQIINNQSVGTLAILFERGDASYTQEHAVHSIFIGLCSYNLRLEILSSLMWCQLVCQMLREVHDLLKKALCQSD